MIEVVTAEGIAGWDAELRALTDGLGWLFGRPEPRVTLGLMVRALLADVPKKSSWGLAEYLGLPNPQPLEHLLNGAVWDVDALRDAVRSYVLGGLADPDGVLVLDDTQAVKKGARSVGVAPQYCGLTGDTQNCQCMVMLSYASRHGHAFIDRELYLPEVWTADRPRCRAAGVPDARGFATKPHLGVGMLERVLADPALRFAWLAADAGYGRDPVLRGFCHDRRIRYVLAVPVDLPLVGPRGEACRPDGLLAATGKQHWERRSCGAGAKGGRFYDWAAHAVTVTDQPPADGFAHTLLIRRAKTPKVTKRYPEGRYDVEYFLVHAPVDTPIPQMISAAGSRWNIEDDNKAGKDLVGMDQYQVRNWTPWHRHVTICMLAQAFLAVTRANLGKNPRPGKAGRAADRGRDRLQPGRHPLPARRDRAGPPHHRSRRRDRSRPLAPHPPDQSKDQPLSTPRRPLTSRSQNVVQADVPVRGSIPLRGVGGGDSGVDESVRHSLNNIAPSATIGHSSDARFECLTH